MESSVSWRQWKLFALTVTALFCCFRLAHWNLLWADEDYHIAAAINILNRKLPYRDFWYDKPPLNAFFYFLIGGFPGLLLRTYDAAYVFLACYIVGKIGRFFWSEWEGVLAGLLLSFYLTFYLPSAVIPFAADGVMLVPHLLAIYYTCRRQPLLAGAFAGIGFLANVKALFVLAVCSLWLLSELGWILLGFLLSSVAAAVLIFTTGAWAGYIEQVWRWGWVYAIGSPVTDPLPNALSRTVNWLGFHSGLVLGFFFAVLCRKKENWWKLASWAAFSFAAVALGNRFAPHYFLQLLPSFVVIASRGIVLGLEKWRRITTVLLILTMAVPLVRFGPRYLMLLTDDLRRRKPAWSDVAMDLDSQQAAAQIRPRRHLGDTLFVWGYRPDIYVYTRMVSDSRFWDSQPLTGVAADRHLHATGAIYGGPAYVNRLELTRSSPTWIVDGLGLLNPKLAPTVYPELHAWLAHYKLVGRTSLSLIYHRVN